MDREEFAYGHARMLFYMGQCDTIEDARSVSYNKILTQEEKGNLATMFDIVID